MDEFIWCFISKTFRYGACVTRGSHSFTCHPHTNHTVLYSPAARRHRPLAGTHCAYQQRDGQAGFTWMAYYIPRYPHLELNPDTVTHPSTNRAWRRVTSLMCATPLQLSQTVTGGGGNNFSVRSSVRCPLTVWHLFCVTQRPLYWAEEFQWNLVQIFAM